MLVALAALLWLGFAALVRYLRHNPRGRADLEGAIAWAVILAYSRLFHRLRVEGREHIPARGPLIVVSNHTAGLDPLLIQAGMRDLEIRWMMARDMMIPELAQLWEWLRIIPVARSRPGAGGRGDAASAREAMRHLKRGGVLGVFPEGGIERPPGIIRPFAPGVGLLALKTGAPVLPVAISGPAYRPTAWGSLFRPSRSRVEFLDPVCYKGANMDAEQVAADIQRRIARALGWPIAHEPGDTDE
jgi:1-acyl-sn-glycerol-3-phosphate acyltransferase